MCVVSKLLISLVFNQDTINSWHFTESLKEEVKGTNQRLDRAYDQQEQHHHEKTRRALTDKQQRCHQAFKISNYTEQKDINPRRVEGTCQWALQSPHYIRWWESCTNDLLWVSADPGCGKSVLAKSIIDDYLEASSSAVTTCYFFFKDNDEQNNLASALCAILHQIFSQQPHLVQHAMPSWEKNGEKLQQEVHELWRIFMAATSAQAASKTICILDALDECREVDQGRLINMLKDFYLQPCSATQDTWLKFLVTSRPYNHIQDNFRVMTNPFPYIHLKGEEENDQIHEEINVVVKIRVKELAEMAQLSSDMHQQLEQQLLQMKHRTYLWLYLAIDDIRTTLENSLRPAEEPIQQIPPSVHAAYRKILNRVPSGQVHTVRRILQIIVAARRPLTTQEMAMALGIAIRPESRTAAQAGINPATLGQKIRQLCGLFIFINNSKIYLIHQTAREFLISKEVTDHPNFAYSCSRNDTESLLAMICIRYLSIDDLEDNEVQSGSDFPSFLNYSAEFWPDHVRNMPSIPDRELNDLLNQVYNTTTKQFSLWFPIFQERASGRFTLPEMNAIQLAVFNGHEQVVRRLLAGDSSIINIADESGSHPLMWASLNGHEKVVQILLEHGADVNAHGGYSGTALYTASCEGHDKIVQVLLKHGADVNVDGGRFGNALMAASFKGHDKIVQILQEAISHTRGASYDFPSKRLKVS